MNSNDHQRLYRLLEYKVLNTKRRRLVAAHVLDGLSLAAGCKLIGLNVGRESRREDVIACLAAYRRAQDPDGKDELYETTRRLDLLWNGVHNPALAYDQFATVNLPWGPEHPSIYLMPDGKTVDAAGLPVPAPPKPDLSKRPCDSCGVDYPHGTVCGACQFKAAGRPLPQDAL
jgi:hypothetical protein